MQIREINMDILNLPNINRGRSYQSRVCIKCEGEPKEYSNYCKPCKVVFNKSLMTYLNINIKDEEKI